MKYFTDLFNEKSNTKNNKLIKVAQKRKLHNFIEILDTGI